MIELKGTGSTTTSSTASSTAVEQNNKIQEVAGQFEALMLNSMMKSMRATLSGDSLAGSSQQDTYQEMMDKQVIESIVSGEGLGLKKILAQQLSQAAAGDLTVPMENFQSNSTTPMPHAALAKSDAATGVELMSRLRVSIGSELNGTSDSTNKRW